MSSTRSGFTLLETVIAIALAAAGLAAVYQVYASAAQAERAAGETEQAARLIEHLLAAGEAGSSGETSGYAWTIESVPTPGFDQLETFTIRITAPSGREIELSEDRPRRQEGPV
jgi:prepilin-type N-terminal cleavage/methylation domain-containing protein